MDAKVLSSDPREAQVVRNLNVLVPRVLWATAGVSILAVLSFA